MQKRNRTSSSSLGKAYGGDGLMVTVIDDIIAKLGTKNQKINALKRMIAEQEGYKKLYTKMANNAEQRILEYESRIEVLDWKKR